MLIEEVSTAWLSSARTSSVSADLSGRWTELSHNMMDGFFKPPEGVGRQLSVEL